MESPETHTGKADEELKRWGARIDALLDQAKDARTEANFDYHERLDELKTKYRDAQQKLRAIRPVGRQQWDAFQGEFESAWGEFETVVKKLTS